MAVGGDAGRPALFRQFCKVSKIFENVCLGYIFFYSCFQKERVDAQTSSLLTSIIKWNIALCNGR